jgi:hypothetical protein
MYHYNIPVQFISYDKTNEKDDAKCVNQMSKECSYHVKLQYSPRHISS